MRTNALLRYCAFLCVLVTCIARSQPDSVQSALTTPDTVAPVAMPELTPAFSLLPDSAGVQTAGNIQWYAPRYLGEVLSTYPGAYLREQSSAGQYSQINFRGTDWRGVGVLTDGRPMNDPGSGIYNLYQYNLEDVERVEVIPGVRSFLYGPNTAGGTINLVTKHRDSNRPYSKINFSEGVYEYSLVDGTFSQNISKPFNVSLGFQRQGTKGRYSNSLHDAWNARARIRYRIAERVSIVLSEYHTATTTGLNGGITAEAARLPSAFFPLETTVQNDDAYEKITRNDVDLSLVGFFLGDSVSTTRLGFYYSNNFREYRDETGGAIPNAVFIQSNHTSSWMGSLFTQRIEGSFHRFDLGANIEIRQIEGSPNLGRRRNVVGGVYAKEELFFGSRLSIAGYGRYDRYLNEDYFGFGGDATLGLVDGLSVFGGVSRSSRLPTYQELFWTDSTVSRVVPLVEEDHTHIDFGLEYRIDQVGLLRAAYFRRQVHHPLLALPWGQEYVFPRVQFANGTAITSEGVETRFNLHIWHLALHGSATYMRQESDSTLEAYPDLWLDAGIYFWDRMIDGNLYLKAGFRGRYQTESRGMSFNGELPAYVGNSNQNIGAGGSVDFVLVAGIGDAYIHFIWENLGETRYFTSAYYPALDRAIRFGVAWEFLD